MLGIRTYIQTCLPIERQSNLITDLLLRQDLSTIYDDLEWQYTLPDMVLICEAAFEIPIMTGLEPSLITAIRITIID